jgi:tetratricopeptide (TPR) repeat protein
MNCRLGLPSDLRRTVLEEARFVCACAATRHLDSLSSAAADLEIHHIRPYSEVLCHKFDNLIPLCPNCHEKADRGKISPWALHQLKAILPFCGLQFAQRKRKVQQLLRKYLTNRSALIGEGFYTAATFFSLVRTQEVAPQETASIIQQAVPWHHPDLVLSALYLEIGLPKESVRVLKKSDLRANPTEHYIRLRADATDRTGNHASALRWYNKLARTCKPSVYLSCNLGDCLIYLGQAATSEPQRKHYFERALKTFEASPRADPGILFNKGRLLAAMGRSQEAIKTFKVAIEEGPHLPLPHVFIADLLAKSGNIGGSLRHYRQALALRPRYTTFLLRACDVANDAGEFDEAWNFLCAYEKNNPYVDQNERRRFLLRRRRLIALRKE